MSQVTQGPQLPSHIEQMTSQGMPCCWCGCLEQLARVVSKGFSSSLEESFFGEHQPKPPAGQGLGGRTFKTKRSRWLNVLFGDIRKVVYWKCETWRQSAIWCFLPLVCPIAPVLAVATLWNQPCQLRQILMPGEAHPQRFWFHGNGWGFVMGFLDAP